MSHNTPHNASLGRIMALLAMTFMSALPFALTSCSDHNDPPLELEVEHAGLAATQTVFEFSLTTNFPAVEVQLSYVLDDQPEAPIADGRLRLENLPQAPHFVLFKAIRGVEEVTKLVRWKVDFTPPAIPQVSAIKVTDTTATLLWKHVADVSEVTYTLHYHSGTTRPTNASEMTGTGAQPGDSPVAITHDREGGDNRYVLRGLKPSSWYYFLLVAKDEFNRLTLGRIIGSRTAPGAAAVGYLPVANTFAHIAQNSSPKLVFADFDNDGDKDYLALHHATGSLWFHPGKGDGSFGTPQSVGRMDSIQAIRDFDRDGAEDVLGILGTDVLILRGKGDGTFVEWMAKKAPQKPQFITTTRGVGLGDFDGDDILDLLLSYSFKDTVLPSPLSYELIVSYGGGTRGQPSGQFVDAPTRGISSHPDVFPAKPLVRDLDADGIDDIFDSEWEFFILSQRAGIGTSARRIPLVDENVPQFADVDQDGFADLLQISKEFPAYKVVWSAYDAKSKSFVPPQRSLLELSNFAPGPWKLVDVNRDGLLDICVRHRVPGPFQASEVHVYHGRRDPKTGLPLWAFPHYTERLTIPFPVIDPLSGTSEPEFSLADLDGDGFLDFLSLHRARSEDYLGAGMSTGVSAASHDFVESAFIQSWHPPIDSAIGKFSLRSADDLLLGGREDKLGLLPANTFEGEPTGAFEKEASVSLASILSLQPNETITSLHGAPISGNPYTDLFVTTSIGRVELVLTRPEPPQDPTTIRYVHASPSLGPLGKARVLTGRFVSDRSRVDAVLWTPLSRLLVFVPFSSTGMGQAPPVQLGSLPKEVQVCDFDGDGFDDLVTVSENRDALEFLLTKHQSPSGRIPMDHPLRRVHSLSTGDVNGDGLVDLIFGTDSGEILFVLLERGAGGTFTFGSLMASSSIPGVNGKALLRAVDLTDDGLVDLVVVAEGGEGSNRALVFENRGSIGGTSIGPFNLLQEIKLEINPEAIFPALLNGDPNLDLVFTSTQNHGIALYLGRARTK